MVGFYFNDDAYCVSFKSKSIRKDMGVKWDTVVLRSFQHSDFRGDFVFHLIVPTALGSCLPQV